MKTNPLSRILCLYQTSGNIPQDRVKSSELFLIFLAIALSGTLINISILLQFSVTFIILLTVFFLIIKNAKVNRLALQNTVLIVSSILFIFLGKYFLSESESIIVYASYFTNMIISLLILLYFSSKPEILTKGIYIVLYFIMLHAFLSLLAWYLIGNFLSYSSILKTYTFGYLFYYVYTDSDVLNAIRTINIFGFSFFRMSGIFWEPGILQIYMNILLFLSLYIYPNIRIAILSALVIFTTWSSTGLVILTVQILVYSFLKMSKKNIIKTASIMGIFIVMLIPLQQNLTDKLEGEDSGSGFARALDTMTAINIIQNNPLFGIEMDSKIYEKELFKNRAIIDMIGSREERKAGNTNSILNYAVFLGIPLAILILFRLYRQNIFPSYNLLFFLIILIAISTEPIGFYIFPLMLIFSTYILKNSTKRFS